MVGVKEAADSVGYLSIIGAVINAIVTWLLVVAGWGVVQDQAKFQERIRANVVRLDSLRALLDEIEELALELHSSTYDELKNRRAKRLLKKIAIDCKLLAESSAVDSIWTKYMVSLRQAVTLQNFDRSTFRPQAPDSSVFATIETAKDNFDGYLASRICKCALVKRGLIQSVRSMFA